MTLTGNVASHAKLFSQSDMVGKLRKHPIFAKMPRKRRVSSDSYTLRSTSRLLKWTHSLIPRVVKSTILRRLSLRSASHRNGSLKARELLARLVCSQFGRTVTINRARASLLFNHRPKIATDKGLNARGFATSALKPNRLRTLEKYGVKKNLKKEKKPSKDDYVTLPKTITPFDRSSAFDELNKSSFGFVRKVASGINGDVFKYSWWCGDKTESVAVKKLRNSSLQVARSHAVDERSAHFRPCFVGPQLEDALTELGVLSYLSRQPDLPQYLVRMHGIFFEDSFTCLVTEFAEGGELFAVAASESLVSDSMLQGHMRQLLQGVEYLHRHSIGHRDISLENILLKDGAIKLMDFGVAVSTHSSLGVPLRYFCAAGKDFYRAPEMIVPKLAHANVIAPFDAKPNGMKTVEVNYDYWCDVRFPENVVPGQSCFVEVCGYTVPPADVFAVGICLFMIAFKCPPWEQANLSNEIFKHFFTCTERGLESLLKSWNKEPRKEEIMLMLTAMLHPDPSRRPSAASCLKDCATVPN